MAAYQKELIETHYQEVDNMYRQIRGWRHDYRNHIQTMKAYAATEDWDAIRHYLDLLDKDLTTVDTVIKTGNAMTDAILNSKISLARSKDIQVIADADIPVKLNSSEIDLCCIIGNLFDNAIEASLQLPKEKRLIRIYMDMKNTQLYISFTNFTAGKKLKKHGNLFKSTKGEGHGLGLIRIDDIVKLPFTTKHDLRDNYPFGLCAVPMSQIVRIHTSSGTTGKPTVVGYTRKDLSTWAECISRAFTAYGAGRSDIFQVSYGYGLFTGGLGAHAGAENIGASVITMSSGNTEKQITLMHDFGSTVLCCTPSYALYLADAIKDSGLPREEFQLKVGAFGAEPWTENMRHEIEEKLGIKAYDIYGLSEIAGPGVGYECECQHGTHLNEDHYFPEIIDPNTLQPVESGQTGELVFTHLTKEGMPLLRYRTRDLTALHHDKCSCGRTLVRMDRILGRSDDMLIIRGVNVFPTQIESVILEMEEFEPHYLLIVGRENNTDTMELQVEVRPEFYSDEINKMLALKKKLGGRLQSVLGLGVNVKLVEPRSIERSVGKAKRVIDNRKM